jgi:hypothetical protein
MSSLSVEVPPLNGIVACQTCGVRTETLFKAASDSELLEYMLTVVDGWTREEDLTPWR